MITRVICCGTGPREPGANVALEGTSADRATHAHRKRRCLVPLPGAARARQEVGPRSSRGQTQAFPIARQPVCR